MSFWKRKEEAKKVTPYRCVYVNGRTNKRYVVRVSDGDYIIPIITTTDKDSNGNKVYTRHYLLYADPLYEQEENKDAG